MYSGNKRFYEIAEAMRAAQPFNVAGILQSREQGPPFQFMVAAPGQNLESAWQEWIREETCRRVGFGAFVITAWTHPLLQTS